MKLLITGTSSGIGRFLVRRLGGAGHEIWGLARSSQNDLEHECRRNGIWFRASACDVSVWAQLSQARGEAGQIWSSLDGLICCAGVQPPIGPAMQLEPLDWTTNIRINLDGTFFAIRAFYDLLLRAPRRAKVICFSGGGATSPRPHFSAYASSKAAVVRLVETLAQEWNRLAIDINAVAPGAIYTKMTEEVLQLGPEKAGEKEYSQAAQQKIKGEAALETAGGLVDFLLSPASDGISGKLISAPWDPWADFPKHKKPLHESDIYTLRRIRPEDRGLNWDKSR